ncbi:NAD(P)H-hydrate epimerase [Microbacterium sp. CFH 90308]|uniref:NAD(P)H-hydrate epimerase n=1 Tax=Microbacterium salsuginis TaxID=2722803 RepID=A0ABX1KIA9_9MICO|nr:NAD(P)H-hydrate epimerase [Microbacterium sp. CFH 90308]NLP85920.1 NAD(P)H-hydrate epimerase [Microbacterium sp. CFH 90308]
MTQVPVFTAEQVRIAEAPLLAAEQPLMARAAAALADVVRRMFQDGQGDSDAPAGAPQPIATAHARHLLVLAGSGNNGGDALYAAAHLAEEVDVDVLTVGVRVHEAGLASALGAGARRVEIPAVREAAGDYDLILDGILGIGATDLDLRGSAREAVEALLPAVRAGRSRVIAVDLPSGLHPDTGDSGSHVLPASVTVTFGAVKAGLVTGRGPELAGELVLADIGLGPELDGFVPVGEASVSRVVTG